ncbi:ATP-dependent DNA helicase [Caerostris extrusa]|uniref:ATP-dependent DNA helicase n=1 Tax=Caerostris extrusa TaxID=172846 RepID=A0AAV4RY44_CAEEX|nr:ATP-dependent DNA helicase [Caerostris extrusa]
MKHHLKPLVESVEIFPNQDLGIHVLVANFRTKVFVAALYAKPGSRDDGITDAIDESLDNEIYYMTLRTNIAQYTMRARTSIDAVFSTHSVRTCGLYHSVFSHHLSLYVQVPCEKAKHRTADPPEDDDPRLECGPDPWNFAAQIDCEDDDDGYPM